jgi:hypothetical protein
MHFDTVPGYTLGFGLHTHTTHTSAHSNLFPSRCLVAASNGGYSHPSGIPNFSYAPATDFQRNASQRRYNSSPQTPSSLTDSSHSTHLSCLERLDSDHTRNTFPLLLCHCCVCVCTLRPASCRKHNSCSVVYDQLFSNGSRIFAYFGSLPSHEYA